MGSAIGEATSPLWVSVSSLDVQKFAVFCSCDVCGPGTSTGDVHVVGVVNRKKLNELNIEDKVGLCDNANLSGAFHMMSVTLM